MEEKQLAVTHPKTSLQQFKGEQLPVFSRIHLTPLEANKGAQLSGLKKEKGKDYLTAVIALQINTALEMLPSYQTTPDAVAGVAEMIVDEFWMMKLEEILLAFKRGIMGRYGKVYGALSLNVFFEWINAYNQEQASEFSELTDEREKENWNKKIEGNRNDDRVFEALVGESEFIKPEQRIGKSKSMKEIMEEFEKKKTATNEAITYAGEKGIIPHK